MLPPPHSSKLLALHFEAPHWHYKKTSKVDIPGNSLVQNCFTLFGVLSYQSNTQASRPTYRGGLGARSPPSKEKFKLYDLCPGWAKVTKVPKMQIVLWILCLASWARKRTCTEIQLARAVAVAVAEAEAVAPGRHVYRCAEASKSQRRQRRSLQCPRKS